MTRTTSIARTCPARILSDDRECECGNRKQVAAPACPACEWLDGSSAAEGRLIAVLRILSGPTTLKALAHEARLSERQVLRTVKRLVARRRLRKLVAGDDTKFGERTGSPVAASYVLTERRRRRWRRRRTGNGPSMKPAALAA